MNKATIIVYAVLGIIAMRFVPPAFWLLGIGFVIGRATKKGN